MAKKVALSNKKVEQHNSVLLRIFCILFDYEVFCIRRSDIESRDRRLRIHRARFGKGYADIFQIYRSVYIEHYPLIWQAGVAHSRSDTAIFCRKKLRNGKSLLRLFQSKVVIKSEEPTVTHLAVNILTCRLDNPIRNTLIEERIIVIATALKAFNRRYKAFWNGYSKQTHSIIKALWSHKIGKRECHAVAIYPLLTRCRNGYLTHSVALENNRIPI